MPKVWNKHHKNAPNDAVYVGRPSVWGNPYTHMKVGTIASYTVKTRDDAVTKFRDLVEGDSTFRQNIKEHLKGKDLVCWCAPKTCHADVLLEIANED